MIAFLFWIVGPVVAALLVVAFVATPSMFGATLLETACDAFRDLKKQAAKFRSAD